MIRKLSVLDWRAVILPYRLAFLIYPLTVFFVGFATSQMLVVPFSAWLALTYSTNPFFAEEKGQLNNLFLTLPVTRRQIVSARYIFSLVSLAVGLCVGFAVMPVVRYFSNSQWFFSTEGCVAIAAVSVLSFAVFSLLQFPLLFNLGYQRGKVWGLYLPAVVFGVVLIVYNLHMMLGSRNITLEFLVFANDNMLLVSGGLFALAAVVMVVSYKLSVRAYSRRGF